jgi:sulfide:quinone oxidoreductase
MKRIVIIGGGTAGTIVANRLRRRLGLAEASIVVIDGSESHLYQPGLLFVPFGDLRPEALVRPRTERLHSGIQFVPVPVARVDVATKLVHLEDGDELGYDVLVIASGAALAPEETEGLQGPEWGRSVFTFYTLPEAIALREALREFRSGRIVVNVVDMPIKCPVAPLEFTFLADAFLERQGRRNDIELSYVTPLDAAFTKPIAARALGGLLADKRIEVVTGFATASVESDPTRLVSYDGREVDFDLAVVIPAHSGAPFIARSEGLGDELNFVMTDPHTLQAKAAPDVFALGDATDLPSSKAGSVAHFQSSIVVDNICRHLADEPVEPAFDGHANCFIETGHGKALLVDFNSDVEPVPGRYPGRIGLPLLRQSRLNHLGKLAFRWLYWHVLLPGREMPGIGERMPVAGKRIPVPVAHDRSTS